MNITKFYRNFILCGQVDYFCLICEEIFHKFDDIDKHIRWEKHRLRLKLQTCLPKFKNEGIFKIQNNYYCQLCNNILEEITIKAHITSHEHKNNKTSPNEFKIIDAHYNSGTVVINRMKIDRHQWHGIIDKNCLLCNVRPDEMLKHIENRDHIIRLIQTNTKYDGENKCYRVINGKTFQCFTCKKAYPTTSFDDHWLNKAHLKKIDDEGPGKFFSMEEFLEISKKSYNIQQLAKIKDDFFEVNLIKCEIVCKICEHAIETSQQHLASHLYRKHKIMQFEKSKILSYIQDEIKKQYVASLQDRGKARHDLAVYGKDNYIKLNAGGSKGYCMLCDKFVVPHINNFKQHVIGQVHVAHLELRNQIKPRKHAKCFTKSEDLFSNLDKIEYDTLFDAFVIYGYMFIIDKYSFLLLKTIDHGEHFQKIKCYVCDEIFDQKLEISHCMSNAHKDNLFASKLVSKQNCLIREIKPKLYHCGLCNTILPFWELLEKHMSHAEHQLMAKQTLCRVLQRLKMNDCENYTIKIEKNSNVNILYCNIMKALFGDAICSRMVPT